MTFRTALGRRFGARGVPPAPTQGGGIIPAYPYKPISNRTRLPNESGGASNVQLMAQSRHLFMEDMNNSLFKAGWANFRAEQNGNGEAIPGSIAAGRASIHYYDRAGLYQIKRLVGFRSGTGSETADPGAYVDLVETISALQGSPYFLRFWGQFPEGMNHSQNMADYLNGDTFRYGTTTTDLTGVDTAFSDTFQGSRHMFLPAYIEGVATRPTVGINEDSRGLGLKDVPNDDYGLTGQFDRLLGKRMASHNVSVPGGLASAFKDKDKYGRSQELLRRCDYHAYGLGTNDTIFQDNSLATILADGAAIAAIVGKPTIAKTIDPSAIGTTVDRAPREAIRLGYSDALVAGVPWAAGCYDPRSVLESGRTGLWAQETYHASGDKTHESNVGNQTAAANAGFNYNLVGSPSVVPVLKPTAFDPATKSSTIVLSNKNLTAYATGTSPDPVVMGSRGATTGKKYCEITVAGTMTDNQAVAIVGSGFVPGTDSAGGPKGLGATGGGGIYGNNGNPGNVGGGQWVANDVIPVAVDAGAKLAWFRKNGGNWNNNPSANPATGVGGISISYLTGTIFVADVPYPNTVHTVNFGATAYAFAAPAGFGNW